MSRFSSPQMRKKIVEILEAWANKVLLVEFYPDVRPEKAEKLRDLIERIKRLK